MKKELTQEELKKRRKTNKIIIIFFIIICIALIRICTLNDDSEKETVEEKSKTEIVTNQEKTSEKIKNTSTEKKVDTQEQNNFIYLKKVTKLPQINGLGEKIGIIPSIIANKEMYSMEDFFKIIQETKKAKYSQLMIRFLEDETAIFITPGDVSIVLYGTINKKMNCINETYTSILVYDDNGKIEGKFPKGIFRDK